MGNVSSAHIKTHRFRAFSDIPIFIKRHCDLSSANSTIEDPYHPINTGRETNSLSCQCHSFDTSGHLLGGEFTGSPSASSISSHSGPGNPHFCWLGSGFPFSSQHSAKVCLRAALIISHMFQSLPYPFPFRNSDRGGSGPRVEPFADPAMLDPQTQLPRTMPSFACCAMQSSYALLMLFYKTRVGKNGPMELEHDSENSSSTERLIDELRHGLDRIILAVSNYSRAFEALDGMRGTFLSNPLIYTYACSLTNVGPFFF
jgi:hypothetical protein